MNRRSRPALALVLLLLGGCTSVARTFPGPGSTIKPRPFAGVRRDWRVLSGKAAFLNFNFGGAGHTGGHQGTPAGWERVFAGLDLPLSLCADTAFLPYTFALWLRRPAWER